MDTLFGSNLVSSYHGLSIHPDELQSTNGHANANRFTCLAIHDSHNNRSTHNTSHHHHESIVTFLNHSPGIRELCMGCESVDERAVKTIMQYLSQTRDIHQFTYISDARKSADEQQRLMECLANGLQHDQKVTRLECVAFNFCHPPSFDALMQFLYQRGTRLKYLNLSYCQFDFAKDSYMIPCFKTGLTLTRDTLQELVLPGTQLGNDDETLASFLRVLQSRNSQLRSLKLPSVAFGGASLVALADIVAESTSLESLFFSYNFFSGVTKAQKAYFMESVKLKNTSLRVIDLSYSCSDYSTADSSEQDGGTDDELIEVDSIAETDDNDDDDDDDSQQPAPSMPTPPLPRVGFFAADKFALDLSLRRNRNIHRMEHHLLQQQQQPTSKNDNKTNGVLCHAMARLNQGYRPKETSLSAIYHTIHHLAVSSQLTLSLKKDC